MKRNISNGVTMGLVFLCSLIFAMVVQKDGKIEYAPQETTPWTETSRQPETPEIPLSTEPPAETEVESEPSPSVAEKPRYTAAPEGYFEEALFIGDSRTVGLDEYGGIEGATFFASVGFSAFDIEKERVKIEGMGKVTLLELLEQREYRSIYLMTGVNELGYRMEVSINKFTELVQTIRELQPDAVLFIGANLHVSKSLSESSSIYTNSKIDEFNTAISQLADEETIFYLDVNELFDDENGNLDVQYTSDQSHLLGRHYRTWAGWIAERAIIKEKA